MEYNIRLPTFRERNSGMNSDSTGLREIFAYIVQTPPVLDILLDRVTPRSIIQFSRVCKASHRAVSSYLRRTFNINRHLSRFFSNPQSFRSLQARTNTLISGSNALQFFDRSFYPESDLDIYVDLIHTKEVGDWLLDNGYRFVADRNRNQNSDFLTSVAQNYVKYRSSAPPETVTISKPLANDAYGMRSVADVFDFIHHSANTGTDKLKVQLIASFTTPIETIFNFHSTCVLNIISYEKAYSLYPIATYEKRHALICGTTDSRREIAHLKYGNRGWKMIPYPHDSRYASEFGPRPRWIGDKYCWTLPLPITDIKLPPSASSKSLSIPHDNLAMHTWALKLSNGTKHLPAANISFVILASPMLRSKYTVCDRNLLDRVVGILRGAEGLDGRFGARAVRTRFYDAEVCNVVKAYYEMEDQRTCFKSIIEMDVMNAL